jgi:hypothetical protein
MADKPGPMADKCPITGVRWPINGGRGRYMADIWPIKVGVWPIWWSFFRSSDCGLVPSFSLASPEMAYSQIPQIPLFELLAVRAIHPAILPISTLATVRGMRKIRGIMTFRKSYGMSKNP